MASPLGCWEECEAPGNLASGKAHWHRMASVCDKCPSSTLPICPLPFETGLPSTVSLSLLLPHILVSPLPCQTEVTTRHGSVSLPYTSGRGVYNFRVACWCVLNQKCPHQFVCWTFALYLVVFFREVIETVGEKNLTIGSRKSLCFWSFNYNIRTFPFLPLHLPIYSTPFSFKSKDSLVYQLLLQTCLYTSAHYTQQ